METVEGRIYTRAEITNELDRLAVKCVLGQGHIWQHQYSKGMYIYQKCSQCWTRRKRRSYYDKYNNWIESEWLSARRMPFENFRMKTFIEIKMTESKRGLS